MKICVIGCAHGELVDLYEAVEQTEREGLKGEEKISLVLCCGDFQACRTHEDLQTMACPPKYRRMNSFHEYYTGTRTAPVLTVFVGGNHEASNHLQELPYGGWVAPNMYFLGYSGCIRVNDELVIGGLSGIFTPAHYGFGRFERVPYSESMLRSVFHTKRHDVKRLEMVAQIKHDHRKDDDGHAAMDIFLSHDWPDHVACRSTRHEPNVVQLLRRKPFFTSEVERNDLGSPANRVLMSAIKPSYWFAAHMHVKFASLIEHSECCGDHQQQSIEAMQVTEKDPDEIDLEDDDDKEGQQASSTTKRTKTSDDGDEDHNEESRQPAKRFPTKTKFLSLDKIVKGRDFMQVLDIPMKAFDSRKPMQLFYDKDWLAVIKATHNLTPLDRNPANSASEFPSANLAQARHFIHNKFGSDSLPVPMNFRRTVEAMDSPRVPAPRHAKGNPQTDEFLEMLELHHLSPLTVPFEG